MTDTSPFPEGSGVVRWVSTGWLESHLGDPGLTILDVQTNIHEYVKEHIPGSIFGHEGLFRVHSGRIPTTWIPADAAGAVLGSMGIGNDRPTVVYTGSGHLTKCGSFIGDGLEQTFVAYTLARFGHNNVYVLDGGMDKWRAEGRRLSADYPVVRPQSFAVKIRNEYIVGYQEFLARKDSPDVILLDARPSAFYEGQGPWKKAGHIPGAVNLPWKMLMDPENPRLLAPENDIRAVLKEKGVSPEKKVICSCGTGREATNEFLLFKFFLKFPDVRIYEGSFTEWTTYPDNPVVTGKNPR